MKLTMDFAFTRPGEGDAIRLIGEENGKVIGPIMFLPNMDNTDHVRLVRISWRRHRVYYYWLGVPWACDIITQVGKINIGWHYRLPAARVKVEGLT